MAYSDDTEFPKGIAFNNLAAAWTPFASTTSVKVNSVVLANDSASPVAFLITNAAVTATYFTVVLASKASIVLPGFHAPAGLRIQGAAACYATVLSFK